MRIESEPSGALIVVGERVVGHAPIVISLRATARGFFVEAVTIRARFLAADAEHDSASVNQDFSPLDRIPAALVFTPSGVQRIQR